MFKKEKHFKEQIVVQLLELTEQDKINWIKHDRNWFDAYVKDRKYTIKKDMGEFKLLVWNSCFQREFEINRLIFTGGLRKLFNTVKAKCKKQEKLLKRQTDVHTVSSILKDLKDR